MFLGMDSLREADPLPDDYESPAAPQRIQRSYITACSSSMLYIKISNTQPETEPERTASKELTRKQFFPPAIIGFPSNSEQVVFGDVNKHGGGDVQVVLTGKHTSTDAPSLGYRINTLMQLPGLTIITRTFKLLTIDQDQVMMYTKLFLDHLKTTNQYPDDNPRFSTTTSSKKALLYAARAQQCAAHSELVKGEMYEEHRNLLVKITKLRKEALRRRRANLVPLRLDGICTKEQRQSITSDFSATPGSILLITPRVGATGLNGLECASKLIQCEPWWTAAEEAQAYGRLSRPRQDKVDEMKERMPKLSQRVYTDTDGEFNEWQKEIEDTAHDSIHLSHITMQQTIHHTTDETVNNPPVILLKLPPNTTVCRKSSNHMDMFRGTRSVRVI